jgi:hypothetical protein
VDGSFKRPWPCYLVLTTMSCCCGGPGGTDVLLQVKGQDSTALFESMHPAPAERPRALLAALTEVGASE